MTVWNTTATVPYSRNTRRTFAMFHLVDSTAFSAPALSSELLVDSHTLETISGWGNEEITWSEVAPQVTTCWSSCLHCANELREFLNQWLSTNLSTVLGPTGRAMSPPRAAHRRSIIWASRREMGVASQIRGRDTAGHSRSGRRRHSLETERIVDGSSNTVRVESCFWRRTRLVCNSICIWSCTIIVHVGLLISWFYTGEDSLADLHSEFISISHKWDCFGTQLGLTQGTTEAITCGCLGDPSRCLRKVFDEWLKKNYDTGRRGRPSWRRACEAAANPAGGGNKDLATTVAAQHPQVTSPGQEQTPAG